MKLLLVLLLSALSLPAAATFVQRAEGTRNASGTTQTSGSITVTGGNAIYIAAFSGNPDEHTVSASNAGTPVLVKELMFAGGTRRISLWKIESATGGSSTFTVTVSNATVLEIYALEFSGMATSNSNDGAGDTEQGSSVTSVPCGSITTSNANDVIIAFAGKSSGTDTTWTKDPSFDAGFDDTINSAIQYRIVSATSTYSPTFTLGVGANTGGIVFAFKQVASGGGGSTKIRHSVIQ